MFSDVGLSITVLSIMKLKKQTKKNYTERIQNDLAVPSAWPICCYFFSPYWQNVRQYFNLASHRQLHNRIDTLY